MTHRAFDFVILALGAGIHDFASARRRWQLSHRKTWMVAPSAARTEGNALVNINADWYLSQRSIGHF